jgi:hypothetical protein
MLAGARDAFEVPRAELNKWWGAEARSRLTPMEGSGQGTARLIARVSVACDV